VQVDQGFKGGDDRARLQAGRAAARRKTEKSS
jgi:hypothetical protein